MLKLPHTYCNTHAVQAVPCYTPGFEVAYRSSGISSEDLALQGVAHLDAAAYVSDSATFYQFVGSVSVLLSNPLAAQYPRRYWANTSRRVTLSLDCWFTFDEEGLIRAEGGERRNKISCWHATCEDETACPNLSISCAYSQFLHYAPTMETIYVSLM